MGIAGTSVIVSNKGRISLLKCCSEIVIHLRQIVTEIEFSWHIRKILISRLVICI